MKKVIPMSILLAMLVASSASAAMSCASLRMDAEHNITAAGTRVIAWALTGEPNQHFNFDHTRGVVGLANTNLCISADQITEGAGFTLQECKPSSDRQGLIAEEAGKSATGIPNYKVMLKADPRFCLDVKAAANGNPALVILWTCHGGTNQRWYFESDAPAELGRP